jgi:hypothetical protein
MTTRLAQLVAAQAAVSVDEVLRRHVDTTAEVMARELLSDPTFRAEMQTLMREAFRDALADLRHKRRGKKHP